MRMPLVEFDLLYQHTILKRVELPYELFLSELYILQQVSYTSIFSVLPHLDPCLFCVIFCACIMVLWYCLYFWKEFYNLMSWFCIPQADFMWRS